MQDVKFLSSEMKSHHYKVTITFVIFFFQGRNNSEGGKCIIAKYKKVIKNKSQLSDSQLQVYNSQF